MKRLHMGLLSAVLLVGGCGEQKVDLEDERGSPPDPGYQLIDIDAERQKPQVAVVVQDSSHGDSLAPAVEDSLAPLRAHAPATDREDEAGAVPGKKIPVAAPIAYDPQGEFTVQVGIHPSREAGELVRQLSSEGYPAYAIAGADPNEVRVRIGYFKSREEARRFGDLFKEDKGVDYWVDRRANEKF